MKPADLGAFGFMRSQRLIGRGELCSSALPFGALPAVAVFTLPAFNEVSKDKKCFLFPMYLTKSQKFIFKER